MKIYISADMEGATGVTSFDEVTPGNKKYHVGCKALQKNIEEVLDVLAGDITVCDGHEVGENLKELKGAKLICGSGELSMMQGIDKGFDCAFFVGYHSRSGTEGCLAHTYYFSVKNVFFDGKPVGEFGINAALAAYFDVKTAFASGCETFLQEAKEYCSWIVGVNLKENKENSLANRIKIALLNAKLAPIPEEVVVEFHNGDKYTCDGEDYKEKFLSLVRTMERHSE